MAVTSGVFPVFENVFKVGTAGLSSQTADMKPVADLTSFSVSVDGNVQEWTPMTTEGWVRRLMTGKGITITLSGKRNVGDAGNDYIAGLFMKTGAAAETKFEWDFPNGDILAMDVVVNVTALGGESIDVDVLEFNVMSNGKPTYTPAN